VEIKVSAFRIFLWEGIERRSLQTGESNREPVEISGKSEKKIKKSLLGRTFAK
jgi:hypothetical protein